MIKNIYLCDNMNCKIREKCLRGNESDDAGLVTMGVATFRCFEEGENDYFVAKKIDEETIENDSVCIEEEIEADEEDMKADLLDDLIEEGKVFEDEVEED